MNESKSTDTSALDPYADCQAVIVLDRMIDEMYRAANEVADLVGDDSASETEDVAACLLPLAMQLIASLRHCIEGAFLYGAGALIRPIVERCAMLSYLIENPSRIQDWWQCWPKRDQPTFGAMVNCMENGLDRVGKGHHRDMINSLIHGNADTIWAACNREDLPKVQISPHRMPSRPDLANAFAFSGCVCVLAVLNLLPVTYDSHEVAIKIGERLSKCNALIDPLLCLDLLGKARS